MQSFDSLTHNPGLSLTAHVSENNPSASKSEVSEALAATAETLVPTYLADHRFGKRSAASIETDITTEADFTPISHSKNFNVKSSMKTSSDFKGHQILDFIRKSRC